MIRENIEEVRKNIAAACERSGRDPSEVVLLAVSKTKSPDMIREAVAAGQRAFGENYVQELVQKYDIFGDSLDWHMIGHLQRNKVRSVIGKAGLIHSVDSIRLAEQIEKESAGRNTVTNILIEVNVADEASKWGFTVDEAEGAVRMISRMEHVHVCGLMTSAPITEDPESNRIYFRQLRQLFEHIAELDISDTDMRILSMGMTGDYIVAVEEGSTLVRVGTGIFGARNYSSQ